MQEVLRKSDSCLFCDNSTLKQIPHLVNGLFDSFHAAICSTHLETLILGPGNGCAKFFGLERIEDLSLMPDNLRPDRELVSVSTFPCALCCPRERSNAQGFGFLAHCM
jgi:hypothetical protein